MGLKAIKNKFERSSDESALLRATEGGSVAEVRGVLDRAGAKINFLRPVGEYDAPLVQKLLAHALKHDFATVAQPMVAMMMGAIPESQRSDVFNLMIAEVLKPNGLSFADKKALLATFPQDMVKVALLEQRKSLAAEMQALKTAIDNFLRAHPAEELHAMQQYIGQRPVGFDVTATDYLWGHQYNCEKFETAHKEFATMNALIRQLFPEVMMTNPMYRRAPMIVVKNPGGDFALGVPVNPFIPVGRTALTFGQAASAADPASVEERSPR